MIGLNFIHFVSFTYNPVIDEKSATENTFDCFSVIDMAHQSNTRLSPKARDPGCYAIFKFATSAGFQRYNAISLYDGEQHPPHAFMPLGSQMISISPIPTKYYFGHRKTFMLLRVSETWADYLKVITTAVILPNLNVENPIYLRCSELTIINGGKGTLFYPGYPKTLYKSCIIFILLEETETLSPSGIIHYLNNNYDLFYNTESNWIRAAASFSFTKQVYVAVNVHITTYDINTPFLTYTYVSKRKRKNVPNTKSTSPCGHVKINEQSLGEFTSPNYPDAYPSNCFMLYIINIQEPKIYVEMDIIGLSASDYILYSTNSGIYEQKSVAWITTEFHSGSAFVAFCSAGTDKGFRIFYGPIPYASRPTTTPTTKPSRGCNLSKMETILIVFIAGTIQQMISQLYN